MWLTLMYQKHIKFEKKKHLKLFIGEETFSIVSCPIGDTSPRDYIYNDFDCEACR